MSYDALTTKLTELMAAQHFERCECDCHLGATPGGECEPCRERHSWPAKAAVALAAPAHEYAAVALAAVTALEQDEDELGELVDCPSCGHELWRGAHDDGCWYVALQDALDALQARVLP